MKISDASSPEAARRVEPAADPASKQTEQAAVSGSVEDHVCLGSVAVAASNSLDGPDAKIAELRQQYLDGTYQVQPDKVSAKIVDEHLQK